MHYLAESYQQVVDAVVYGDDEPRNFHRFLDKFNMLDKIKWTEDLIDRSIQSICLGLEEDNIDYTWMRFSINKYMTYLKWHRSDAIKFVYDSFQRYAPDRVGLVLCLKYEAERAGQKQLAATIKEDDVADCLIGLDLVGDEAYYDVDFYKPIFDDWKKAGKKLFAHVGESQSADNIKTAIEQLGVTEINHGIKAWNREDILESAVEHNVCFHMALTSNELTGVLADVDLQVWHPIIDMIDRVQITIGTDDPVQCNTTMDKEYKLLANYFPEDNREYFVDVVQKTAEARITL
jgi:adenosine deaminase